MSRASEERGQVSSFVCNVRKALIFADDMVHVLVAFTLLVSAALMLFFTISNFFNALDISSILLVINDILFVLIIMELLWTVLRYLRRQEFSLNPFIGIGIISSLRRILMLEAQMAMTDHAKDYYFLAELGLNTAIVFVLVIAYYLLNKADKARAAKA